MLINTNGLSI